MVTSSLQPDQQPDLWSEHADAYEAVFEPLTDRFAQAAVAALGLAPGQRCLDVAAGAGGAALMAAREGATVLAIDAAPGMVDRIRLRAMRSGLPVEAASMDAQALALDDGSFDAALSIFGIILCPDPVRALKEAARLVRPGGKIAIVTWTEPQNYELITRLLAAIAAVRGPQPSLPGTPAQLRFSDDAAFRTLFGSASLEVHHADRGRARSAFGPLALRETGLRSGHRGLAGGPGRGSSGGPRTLRHGPGARPGPGTRRPACHSFPRCRLRPSGKFGNPPVTAGSAPTNALRDLRPS
jgi:SAM-dependent methyltransferase